jgi:hypothetical protein
MGLVLARCQTLPKDLDPKQRSAATTWLVANDKSQREEPDKRLLEPLGLFICYGKGVPSATTLADGCAPSTFNATCPLHWQMVSVSAPVLSVIEQCARAMRRAVPVTPSTRSLPSTPRI